MAAQSRLIKFDVHIYKRDNVSFESFVHWATVTYPPQVIPLMKKYGLLRYTQTIVPQEPRELLRETLKTQLSRPDWSVPDYDLVISYWLRDLEDMQKLSADPEWLKLEADALNWANMSIGHLVYGHEIVHFTSDEVPGQTPEKVR